MNFNLKLAGGMFLLSLAAMAQAPSIRSGGINNALGYNTELAPGAYFVIFGSNMGPANIVVDGSVSGPTLSGTSVSFTPAAGGAAIPARMYYTLAGQIAGYLPSTAAPGDYDVRVTYNAAASAAQRVTVRDRAIGLATANNAGTGVVQGTIATENNGVSLTRFTRGSLSFNGLNWVLRPVFPGDVVTLWGTGLGADATADGGGNRTDQTAAGNVRVFLGTLEITPSYAGRSGLGLDQINFTVPNNAALGCTTTLTVRAGGRFSNLVTLPIASRGSNACTMPGFTEDQLRRLDGGGTVTYGTLSATKITVNISVSGFNLEQAAEVFSGGFIRYTAAGLADAPTSFNVGECAVWRRRGLIAEVQTGPLPQALNAGPQFTVNGPGITNRAMTRTAENNYVLDVSPGISIPGLPSTGGPGIAAGTYTITGPGGPDVGVFSASLAVPGDFRATNLNAIATINRSAGQNFTWTGGGTGLVAITGFAAARVPGIGNNNDQTTWVVDAAGFTCLAQASQNSFTVPGSVLSQLPVTGNDLQSGNFGSISVLAVPDFNSNTGRFTAPLTAGGNVDFSVFTYQVGTQKFVGYN